jgi:hypothetical protein
MTLAATPATAREMPQTMAAPASNGAHLVIGLSATSPVWISATIDGRPGTRQLLRAGEQRTIQIGQELVLTASDAAAIHLTLNGAEARELGRPGEAVTTRLNLTNFRNYLRGGQPR